MTVTMSQCQEEPSGVNQDVIKDKTEDILQLANQGTIFMSPDLY